MPSLEIWEVPEPKAYRELGILLFDCSRAAACEDNGHLKEQARWRAHLLAELISEGQLNTDEWLARVESSLGTSFSEADRALCQEAIAWLTTYVECPERIHFDI